MHVLSVTASRAELSSLTIPQSSPTSNLMSWPKPRGATAFHRGVAALEARADLIVSSVSAFANPALLDELRLLAVNHDAQIHIQPGALGGVDALASARPMGIDSVEHRIVKPPNAWGQTPNVRVGAATSAKPTNPPSGG